jgi:dethiobiotin synthetase
MFVTSISTSTSSTSQKCLLLVQGVRHRPRRSLRPGTATAAKSFFSTTPDLQQQQQLVDDHLAPAEVISPNASRFWHYDPLTGRSQRPIFVAATKQHVGKTTTCLALLSGLQKRFDTVGFLKPVGQQHVQVESGQGLERTTLQVDKDVVLMREHFHLDHIEYKYMSPVIIPQGYTRKYVDGEITLESQQHDVEVAMEHVASRSDITLIEGTGHCAVGSIVGLNNAKVASQLGADMVLMYVRSFVQIVDL